MDAKTIIKCNKIIDRTLYELFIQKQVTLKGDSSRFRMLENKFRNSLIRLFREWEQRILARIGFKQKDLAEGEMDVVVSIIQQQKLAQLIKEYIESTGQTFFDQQTPQTVQWFSTYSEQLATNITNRIQGNVSSQILYSMQAGENTAEMGRRIKNEFDGLKRYESDRIARTESMRAYNESFLDTVKDEQLVDVVQVDPCDVCVDLVSEYPKSAKEAQGDFPAHPNCRCELVEFIDLEAETRQLEKESARG